MSRPLPPDASSIRDARVAQRPLLVAALAGLLGAVGCDDEHHADGKRILSSVTDPSVTRESFEAVCTERGGTLELHAHCGGANSCHGLSYDTDTHVLTEHTCQGMNTCAGFSCVDPDDAG